VIDLDAACEFAKKGRVASPQVASRAQSVPRGCFGLVVGWFAAWTSLLVRRRRAAPH